MVRAARSTNSPSLRAAPRDGFYPYLGALSSRGVTLQKQQNRGTTERFCASNPTTTPATRHRVGITPDNVGAPGPTAAGCRRVRWTPRTEPWHHRRDDEHAR